MQSPASFPLCLPVLSSGVRDRKTDTQARAAKYPQAWEGRHHRQGAVQSGRGQS